MAPSSTPLPQAFGFTEEQLASNREGQVAEGQTSVLWTSVLWGVPLSVLALLLGLAALRYARGPLRVVGPLLGLVAALGLGTLMAYPSLRDLVAPTVAAAEGPVTEQTGAGKGPGHAVLTIGGQRLLTQAPTMVAAEAIEKGTVYRAYYLPHTKRLLSIEPVAAAPP